jgi:HAE1 family hydrophobic/amphiphilic exporter-1
MNLSRSAVEKPTTWLIVFIVVAILGGYTMKHIPEDLMPDIQIPYVGIITTYTGAGPEEVERAVTKILEQSLASVSGIKHLHSTSETGTSMIFLEMNYGENLDSAVNNARDAIDRVKKYLPDDIDQPVIIKMDPSMMPVAGLSITGNRTPEQLWRIGDDTIEPMIEQLDGIASVQIMGGREECINITIPRDRLEAYNLTITAIYQLVAAQNIDTAAGTITENGLDYTIQTAGSYKSLDQIRNTVVSYKTVTTPDNPVPQLRTIKLRDIADVTDGYKDRTSAAYIDGKPSVMMMVSKSSDANTVNAVNNVIAEIPLINKELPSDVKVKMVYDGSRLIKSSINNVISSVVEGALFAVIILLLFLRNIKATIIIGVSIPLSVLFTFMCMYFAGFTLNMMTLAGLALGVGMLVDNSVVILENVFHYVERGSAPTVAATLGSSEMVGAITGSTLTTVCVFLPMILLQSQLEMYGQIFQGLAFTVVFSLMASLFTAIFLVPCLSSHYLIIKDLNKPKPGILQPISVTLGRFFDWLGTGYGNAVRHLLHHKKVFVAIMFTCFIGAILIVATGILPFNLFPDQTQTRVQMKVQMPEGTNIDVTEQVCLQLADIAAKEAKGYQRVYFNVGGTSIISTSGSETGTVTVSLYDYDERKGHPDYDTDKTLKEKLRPYFNDFPGAKITFPSNALSGSGGDIDIVMKSDNLDLLTSTSKKVEELLNTKAADLVTDVSNSMVEGLPEVNVVVDRDKMQQYGLTITAVGTEIQGNITGLTAGRYTKNDTGTDIDIVVRADQKDRSRLADLDNMFVTTSAGTRIPMSSFAHYEKATGPVSISRLDQSRDVEITATLKDGVPLAKAQLGIQNLIKANIPANEALRYDYSNGNYAQMKKYLGIFITIIVLAIVLVFAVMAAQFESFKDPFIILFTIPLSFIGIVLIYLICQDTLNMMTAVGFLILLGVIVNNGIVLVDYTNLLRKRGESLEDAASHAAANRLRPILISTLTTILGLVPMAFFPGDGSEMTSPIGKTVLGGLTFGTIMTLFMIPCMYCIFNKKNERNKIHLTKRSRAEFERMYSEEAFKMGESDSTDNAAQSENAQTDEQNGSEYEGEDLND